MPIHRCRCQAPKNPLLSGGFIALISINLIFYVGHYLTMVLTPSLLEARAASAAEVGWVSSIFFLGAIVGRPFSARLIERLNPEPSLLSGFLLTTTACAALPLTTSVVEVACCRVIQGLALALITTALTVLVANSAPVTRLGEALAIFGISSNAAAFFAPALGVTIASAMGYSRAFLAAGASGVLCALFAASMARSKKALEASETLSPESASRADHSNLKRRLAVPSLVIAAFGFTYSVHLSFIIVIIGERGVLAHGAGLYYALYAAAIILARLVGGRALDSRARDWLIALGNFAAGLAMIILGCTSSLLGLAVAAAVYGLGAGHLYPGVMAQMVEMIPSCRRGTAASCFYTSFEAGIAVAGPVFGWMAMWGGYGLALKIIGAIPIAGALLHLRFSERPQDGGRYD
jgi:predicted MFS family arabinose efflux permease